MQSVAQQPVLILLDQRVEQVRIAAPEPMSGLGLFGFHCNQRTEGSGDHTKGIYEPGGEKDSRAPFGHRFSRMNADFWLSPVSMFATHVGRQQTSGLLMEFFTLWCYPCSSAQIRGHRPSLTVPGERRHRQMAS